jgi:hypothetical protein
MNIETWNIENVNLIPAIEGDAPASHGEGVLQRFLVLEVQSISLGPSADELPDPMVGIFVLPLAKLLTRNTLQRIILVGVMLIDDGIRVHVEHMAIFAGLDFVDCLEEVKTCGRRCPKTPELIKFRT